MSFADIRDNEKVKEVLGLALRRGRLPNSMLFTGPGGVGKRKAALTVAKALNCLNRRDDSCDSCAACQAIDADYGLKAAGVGRQAGKAAKAHAAGSNRAGTSAVGRGRFPDVMLVEPENNNIRVELVREVRKLAYLKPMSGRKRVFIFDGAECLNADSQNTLLKVLEEPPADSCFILLTSEPSLILPTIVSRCRVFAFSPFARDDIEAALSDAGLSEEQAGQLAPFVEVGADRERRLDPGGFTLLRREAWRVFEAMLAGRGASLFLERFSGLSRDEAVELRSLVEMFCCFCRDLLVLMLGGDRRFLLNHDLGAELERAAGNLSVDRVLKIFSESDALLDRLEGNYNKSLLVLDYYSRFGEDMHV
jgi:DNA polymerase-3 subunit delta'